MTTRLRLTRAIAVVVRSLTSPVGTGVLRSRHLRRRRNLDVRARLRSALRRYLPHLRDGWRTAAIGLNLLLLFYEGDGSWWRRRLGHDGAALKSRWWLSRTLRAGAEHASLLRCNHWGRDIDLCGLNFPAIDLQHVSSDGPCRRKSFVRCGGYTVRRGLVHVLDVGDVLVDDDRVVVIVYDGVDTFTFVT